MRQWLIAVGLVIGAIGCGDDGGGGDDADAGIGSGVVTPFPELYCPGSPGCDSGGDGVFKVGAARALINPELIETEWDDEDMDGEWSATEDFTDVNNNGEFDAVWIAGFGNGRPATGFNDDLNVRAIAFEYDDIRVAIAVVDVVGWFAQDMDATRAIISEGLDLDHVIIACTHVHEAPDTVGLWGKMELVSGVDPDYKQLIYERTAQAIADAVGALEPVTMSISQVETVDEGGSSAEYVGDGRDPVILDPTMTMLHFQSVSSPGDTVATLVHWAAHPEYSGSRNNLLSADYVHYLRDVIENGIEENVARNLPAIDGMGGEVVFVNGAFGGQIGPGGGTAPIGADGMPVPSSGLPKAEAAGTNLGRLALETMNDSAEVTDIPSPELSFRTGRMYAVVENVFYHVAGLVGVFDRELLGYDEARPIDENNLPYVESRTTYMQIGSVAFISAPGELHPELFIGGYDGSRSYGRPIISEGNENPPNLDNAPSGPYLRDLVLDNPGVEYPLLFGATEDFLGYIVPSYNFVVDPDFPYIEEPDGDHYEETNSIGAQVEADLVGPMRQLIEWRPPSE